MRGGVGRTRGAEAQSVVSAGEQVDVLHVINGEFYAGAERVQELLAARLPAFGYRARFVCLKRGQFQEALEQGPHPCRAVTMRSRLDVVRHARTIAHHARNTGCRLIHTHTPRGALVGSLASAMARLPMVHHVHSPTSRDSARRLTNAVNSLVERAALVRASVLIPVSQSLADHLRAEGYRAERIVPIQNGVAIAGGIGRDERRPGELTIGTVALFRPRKGIEVLLRAMAGLVGRAPSVRLVAVGPFETPEYERSVRTLCRELGLEERVEWRGFQQDVAAELRRMDLLALPSLFGEGMPMVVLEAMAVGLPVVATRVEGVPEVVRDGRDGVLVAPGDAAALCEAIARLAAEPATLEVMGASGRQRQREVFSDVAMAERLSRVYDRLLARPGHREQKGSRNGDLRVV
jgi:glycosyltransferase involved in cell wall biosynthesis